MNLSLEITDDTAIRAGLDSAILKIALMGGFAGDALGDLVTATHEACDAAFALSAKGAPIRVSVRLLADKVEIEVEHEGEPVPAAGLDTFMGGGGSGTAGLALLGRVDGIQYGAANGVSRTTLTKKRPVASRV